MEELTTTPTQEATETIEQPSQPTVTEPQEPIVAEPNKPTTAPETTEPATPQGSVNEEPQEPVVEEPVEQSETMAPDTQPEPEQPTEPETPTAPTVDLFNHDWIYIKIVDGEAKAFGDLASIMQPKEKGGAGDATLSYDYRLTPEEWAKYEYTARVETATPKVATLSLAANAVDTQALETTEQEEPKYSRTIQLDNGPKIIIGKTNAEKLKEHQDFIRLVRDTKLRKCDKMSPMRWYGMTEEQKQQWAAYRQALLDIPQQEGFPWEGNMDAAPWPEEPK